jgi:hypothetical protein
LKKKLNMLNQMVDDLLSEKGEVAKDGNQYKKLTKKTAEYVSSLEHFDEWAEEVEARRKAEEEASIKKQHQEEEEEERRKIP